MTDGALLAAFSATGNQTAFAELVQRHGAMVHGVCLRGLGDHQEAEDATQAVFVTLACKAAALRKDPSVGGWLHTVARRLAKDMRRSRAARQRREAMAMSDSAVTGNEGMDPRLFRESLDDALSDLPDRYRRPLVLFHLEGRSLQQTADQLGLTASATGVRLSRARELLRQKLVRRGVTIGSVGALTALLSAESGAATLPANFVASTVGAAAGTAAVSANVAALSKGALHMLFIANVKTASLTAAACLIVAGTGVVAVKQIEAKAPTAVVIDAKAEADQEAKIKEQAIRERLAAAQVKLARAKWFHEKGRGSEAEVPETELPALQAECDKLMSELRALTGFKEDRVVTPPPSPYERKLCEVFLPRLELADLTLSEAVAALRQAAAESPQKLPINIVVPADAEGRITLSLNNVPLCEAIRHVAMIFRLQCLFEEKVVVLRRGQIPGINAGDSGKVFKPIDTTQPGTYGDGKWSYSYEVKGDQRQGALKYDAKDVGHPQPGDYLLTPWGWMQWQEQGHWLPVAEKPAKGNQLPDPAK
jgi:RNA polymerase sigma factor (sigma-70 family)